MSDTTSAVSSGMEVPCGTLGGTTEDKAGPAGNRSLTTADCKGVMMAVPYPIPISVPDGNDDIGMEYEIELTYTGLIPKPLRANIEQAAPPAPHVRYLYILSSDDDCLYIGQTHDPGARLVAHRESSRFWHHVRHVRIYRHEYAHIWPTHSAEIIDRERQLITDLGPLFNVDRSLSAADRGTPWEARTRKSNLEASLRALALLGRR